MILATPPTAPQLSICGWEHIIPLKHRLSWQAGSSFREENITSILLSGQSGGQGVLIRLAKSLGKVVWRAGDQLFQGQSTTDGGQKESFLSRACSVL